MKLILRARKLLYRLFLGTLAFNIIFWLSVFSYGTFYYFYIPAVAHVRPVHLQFDTSCFQDNCSFPSANVSLVRKGQDCLLARGQHYLIVLDLEMPESDVNRKLGMFMVKLDIYSRHGKVTASSFRSAVLHYKSPLLRVLYTLFFSPFLLSGTSEEKQVLTISLFEHYEEDHETPAYGAHVEIQNFSIEIYSAYLKIHAHFTGLRYFMYYWPVLSAFIGIGTNFFFLAVIAIFSWFRFLILKAKVVRVDIASPNISLETRRLCAVEKLRQEKLLATETLDSKSLLEIPRTSRDSHRSDVLNIENISPHDIEVTEEFTSQLQNDDENKDVPMLIRRHVVVN